MEKREKKINFDLIVSSAGKAAKDILESTVQTVDQNDDGKFDLADVSVIAESVGSVLRKGAQVVAENAEEGAKKLELKTLRPIFSEDLDDNKPFIHKFIRVVDRDKKHAESEVCKGSVGHVDILKGYELVNLYLDSLDAFKLSFYPDSNCEFYCIDPSDETCYIALDEYFSYLKVARVTELQTIAQALGAKSFKVTYKEEKTSFSDKKAKGNIKHVTTADANLDSTEKKYSRTEIAAEMSFPGHEPAMPQLKYLKRDPSVQALIDMRLNEQSPLLEQKYTINFSVTSGLKEKDAIKIDTILKGLKCSGNATVESEVQNEARRSFEYDIRF